MIHPEKLCKKFTRTILMYRIPGHFLMSIGRANEERMKSEGKAQQKGGVFNCNPPEN
jgi:hypothetical protein